MPKLKNISKGDFFDFLSSLAKTYKTRVAISHFENEEWKMLSFVDLKREAIAVATKLQISGIQKGDHVSLLGESSVDWVAHFFGIILAGGVVVPLDIKLATPELASIISHCEPKMIIASRKFRDRARELRTIPKRAAKVLTLGDQSTVIFGDEFKRPELTAANTAVICYTSGTSGAPKGVMIAQRSLLFQAESMFAVSRGVSPRDVMLSVLPLNHLFGITIGLLFSLRCGMEFCMAHDLSPDAIVFCLKSRRATHFQVVPLFLKIMMRGIQQNAFAEVGEVKFKSLLKAASVLRFNKLKRMLFKKIHANFGGTLRRFICGGSDLDPSLFEFFGAVGTPVYNGYGLTETGPVITTNILRFNRKGSVGKPIPGVLAKAIDGEVVTKGPHLMIGYYKDKSLTDETIDSDGWLRTGDLGYFDQDGYLFLNGRKKNLIVLSSGKKVHPEEVEAVLSRSTAVKEVCVVGIQSSEEREERVVAFVSPSDSLRDKFQGNLHQIETEIRGALEPLIGDLTSYKRPHEIIIRNEPFPMTASMKIKRHLLRDELLQQRAETRGIV